MGESLWNLIYSPFALMEQGKGGFVVLRIWPKICAVDIIHRKGRLRNCVREPFYF